ncbi:MAG: sigma-70 family RNA polymerase sigma factor [Candidatus Pacebacteria bacterium]|nr:sigma-70 family RNA polymerase sigma factor [Candidatus Paceibacterota bacterium]
MNDIKKEFGQVYDEYVESIYRFIYIKVNSKDIAEDLTSETFTRAWNAFSKSKSNGIPIDNMRAFCYRTARNIVIDYYKSKSLNSVSLDSVQVIDESVDIEKRAMINSDMDMVMQAITKLKDEYQDVIIWRYLDEMSVPEIAELLGKSEQATRVMIHRAMTSLKTFLSRAV